MMTTLSPETDIPRVVRDLLGYPRSHLRQARRRPVVCVSVSEGVPACLDDVCGRVEVRLAYLEMDHVHPIGLQPARLGQHLEGGLGTQAAHSLGQLHPRTPLGIGLQNQYTNQCMGHAEALPPALVHATGMYQRSLKGLTTEYVKGVGMNGRPLSIALVGTPAYAARMLLCCIRALAAAVLYVRADDVDSQDPVFVCGHYLVGIRGPSAGKLSRERCRMRRNQSYTGWGAFLDRTQDKCAAANGVEGLVGNRRAVHSRLSKALVALSHTVYGVDDKTADPGIALFPLRAVRTLNTLRARDPARPRLTLGPWRTYGSLRPLRPWRPLITRVAFRPLWA